MDTQLQELMTALIDLAPERRTMAEDFFQRAGEKGVAGLIEAAKSDDPRLSIAAFNMLNQLSLFEYPNLIFDLLTSPNMLVADSAFRMLQAADSVSSSALMDVFAECNPLVQINVVLWLERTGCTEAVQPLMEVLAQTQWSCLRYTIIQALGSFGDPSAIDLIQSFSQDPDEHVRSRVKSALSRLTH